MIVIDLNQIMIANFFVSVGKHTNIDIDVGMIRHMILNSIRAIRSKNRDQYGDDMVLACDSMRYWRKDVFPHYKASRKKIRQESDVDWKKLFMCIDIVKGELQNHFPYKYIQVEGAEADDVIATICKHYQHEKILIVSGDKDFGQLHTKNISQYDPVNKRMIKVDDPKIFLHEHILKGDVGDGIPNIVSPGDTFVTGTRQKPLTKKIKENLEHIENDVNDPLYPNYLRNKELIDLSCIPANIEQAILSELNKEPLVKDKKQLLGFFIDNGLKELTNRLIDF